MRTSAVVAFIVAMGVAPSFSLPSIWPRTNPDFLRSAQSQGQGHSTERNNSNGDRGEIPNDGNPRPGLVRRPAHTTNVNPQAEPPYDPADWTPPSTSGNGHVNEDRVHRGPGPRSGTYTSANGDHRHRQNGGGGGGDVNGRGTS